MFLVHLGMHGLDHHDRVIDHNTDRQHQGEERDQVNRHPEHTHEKEGSDQRYGYRQSRDQCAADVSQEEKDHQGHQYECFQQRVQHLLDRGIQEAGNVVADRIVHPRREHVFLEFLELHLDLLDDLRGVGTRGLLEYDGC